MVFQYIPDNSITFSQFDLWISIAMFAGRRWPCPTGERHSSGSLEPTAQAATGAVDYGDSPYLPPFTGIGKCPILGILDITL